MGWLGSHRYIDEIFEAITFRAEPALPVFDKRRDQLLTPGRDRGLMWKTERLLVFLQTETSVSDCVCAIMGAFTEDRGAARLGTTYNNVLLRHMSASIRNKRRTTIEAFKKNHADTPLVTPSIILLPFDNFRRHILAGSDNTHCRSAVTAPVTPI